MTMTERTFPSERIKPEDGFPNIRMENDQVILSDGEQEITIPAKWIEKWSPRVHPGGDQYINRLSLTLFACDITVRNNRDDIRVEVHDEIIPGTRQFLSAADSVL